MCCLELIIYRCRLFIALELMYRSAMIHSKLRQWPVWRGGILNDPISSSLANLLYFINVSCIYLVTWQQIIKKRLLHSLRNDLINCQLSIPTNQDNQLRQATKSDLTHIVFGCRVHTWPWSLYSRIMYNYSRPKFDAKKLFKTSLSVKFSRVSLPKKSPLSVTFQMILTLPGSQS